MASGFQIYQGSKVKNEKHCRDLLGVLHSLESTTDLCFVCKNGLKVDTHKLLMSSVSWFLRNMLLQIPENSEKTIIHVPDIECRIMQRIINLLYGESVRVTPCDYDKFNETITFFGINFNNLSIEGEKTTNLCVDGARPDQSKDMESNKSVQPKVEVLSPKKLADDARKCYRRFLSLELKQEKGNDPRHVDPRNKVGKQTNQPPMSSRPQQHNVRGEPVSRPMNQAKPDCGKTTTARKARKKLTWHHLKPVSISSHQATQFDDKNSTVASTGPQNKSIQTAVGVSDRVKLGQTQSTRNQSFERKRPLDWMLSSDPWNTQEPKIQRGVGSSSGSSLVAASVNDAPGVNSNPAYTFGPVVNTSMVSAYGQSAYGQSAYGQNFMVVSEQLQSLVAPVFPFSPQMLLHH